MKEWVFFLKGSGLVPFQSHLFYSRQADVQICTSHSRAYLPPGIEMSCARQDELTTKVTIAGPEAIYMLHLAEAHYVD